MASAYHRGGKIWKSLFLHLIFWVLVVTYFAWGFGLDVNPLKSFTNALFFLPGHALMVYTLLYFLVPRYLLKRKFWQFFAGFLLLTMLCGLYTVLAQLSVNSVAALQGATLTVGRNILPFIHVGAIAASIKLLKHWYVQRKHTLEAEQQRTVAELKLLKAQLHPHFLFNTLNNLYSHTLEFSPKSPEIVMKLSGLLRFMIYESNTPDIPLSKEIELMQDYIALEQMRYGDRLDISFSVEGDVENYRIAPLLLLPFLENAFKHGTSKTIDQCWINFNLTIDQGSMNFKLINSIDPANEVEKGIMGGIGLSNVGRRLQMLYKDTHRLETVQLEEVFVVSLEINLESLKGTSQDPVQQLIKRQDYAL